METLIFACFLFGIIAFITYMTPQENRKYSRDNSMSTNDNSVNIDGTPMTSSGLDINGNAFGFDNSH